MLPLEPSLPLQQPPPLTEADVPAAVTAAVVGSPFTVDCWVDRWLDPPLPPSAPAGGHLLGRGHWHRAIPGNFRPLPAAAGRAHHAGASAVLVNPAFNPPSSPLSHASASAADHG